MMIFGSKFAFGGFMVNGRFGLERLRGGMVVLIFLMFISIQALAAMGYCLSSRRSTKSPFVAIYGAGLLLIVVIPLLAEGTALIAIATVEPGELDRYCPMTHEEIEKNVRPKWLREVLLMAKRRGAGSI